MKKIIGMVLVLSLLFTLCACSGANQNKYESALEHLKNGEFSDAKRIFDEIPDYKDSSIKSKQCQYLWSLKMIKCEYYLEAMNGFGEIMDFEDSKTKMLEILSIALKKYFKKSLSEEEFEEIFNAYDREPNYLDSPEEISYLLALDFFSQEKYAEAFEYARFIATYKDMDKLCDDALYMRGVQDCKKGDLCSALSAFKNRAEEKYRNSVKHAIEIRREIFCTPFFGEITVDNGQGNTTMIFQKKNDYAVGFVSGFDKSTGNLLVNWKFSAFFAYDGVLLAKDDNIYNLSNCKEIITQDGYGKDAIYSIRFTDGPLNGMSFETEKDDQLYPVYEISEKPIYKVDTKLLNELKEKFLNYDENLTIPESIKQVYSFDWSINNEGSNAFVIDEDENNSTNISSIESNVAPTNNNVTANPNANSENNRTDVTLNESVITELDKNPITDKDTNIVSKPDNTNSQSSVPNEIAHEHEYSDATCTEPPTCTCGATKGEALGHKFDCWGESYCNRCSILNPLIPKEKDIEVVYKTETSTYSGCKVQIGSYYFEDLEYILVNQAGFFLKGTIEIPGSQMQYAAVLVKFYDESGVLLEKAPAACYAGLGFSVNDKINMGCKIPVGTKKIEICDMLEVAK